MMTKHWLTIIAGFFVFASVIILALTLSSQCRIRQYQQKLAAESAVTKEKLRQEYLKSLEKPSYPNPTITNPYAHYQPKALGKQRLYLIFVKPQNMPFEQVQPFFQELISPGNGYSIFSIRDYLYQEMERYSPPEKLDLEIIPKGIYSLSDLAKVGDMANAWGKDPFAVANLKDQFENIAKVNGLAIGEKDLAIFFYFDNSHELANRYADEESFYEYKKFRSFADIFKLRAYVDIYSFLSEDKEEAVTVAIHELLHLFGAADKYIENPSQDVCQKNGMANPDQIPLYPQKAADVMCLMVHTKRGVYHSGRLSQNELVINRVTAKEIGWIKQ